MQILVGESTLNEFDLLTLISKIRRILNDRSLVDVSTNRCDLTALPPSMFLTRHNGELTSARYFYEKRLIAEI